MTQVTFQTMINVNGNKVPVDKTVVTEMTEKEIVSALENSGVKEFTGTNFASSTYQTMPGIVFVKLQNVEISERSQLALIAE